MTDEQRNTIHAGLLAYFLTFTTYGTWLHGDPRGSVDRGSNQFDAPPIPVNARRVDYVRNFRMTQMPLRFDDRQRAVVDEAIRGVCNHKGWPLYALNVRTNHVHAVVAAPVEPNVALNTFKAWATRMLRDARLVGERQKVWTRHGSTRFVWSGPSLERVYQYVVHGQDWVPEEVAEVALDARTLPHGRGSDHRASR